MVQMVDKLDSQWTEQGHGWTTNHVHTQGKLAFLFLINLSAGLNYELLVIYSFQILEMLKAVQINGFQTML